MILSKNINILITTRNIKKYNKEMNCIIGEIIEYPIESLNLCSHNKITVKCDFCEKEYDIQYNIFNRNTKNNTTQTCCSNQKCINEKRLNIINEKYNVSNIFQLL